MLETFTTQVELESGKGTESFTAGSIVQATGSYPYDATRLDHLGYGKSPDVVTSVQFDEMLRSGELARPSDGKKPARACSISCSTALRWFLAISTFGFVWMVSEMTSCRDSAAAYGVTDVARMLARKKPASR